MGFTFWSEARNCLRPIVRSAIEGAAAAAVIVGGLWWKLEPLLFQPAVVGIASALAASTLSVAILIIVRRRKSEFELFLKAYGAGVAIRAGGLVVLVASSWGASGEVRSALLGSYALGVLVLLLVEFREIASRTG